MALSRVVDHVSLTVPLRRPGGVVIQSAMIGSHWLPTTGKLRRAEWLV
ncbi:MAG: hypothetical protein ACRDO4_17825 [Nocardioides sp.]